jgi:hypothetical protein
MAVYGGAGDETKGEFGSKGFFRKTFLARWVHPAALGEEQWAACRVQTVPLLTWKHLEAVPLAH